MVVSEVLPGQGFGDLGDDRLGVGHAGESKNWKYINNIREDRSYMAKGWSTDNVKHSFSSATFTKLVPQKYFHFL